MRTHFSSLTPCALFTLLTLALPSCAPIAEELCGDSGLHPTLEGSAAGSYACLWLAAEKDAWVGITDASGADGDHNHGTEFSLDVADPTFPPGKKRTYVKFYMPELPPGTVVKYACINFYEDSRQTPGTETRPIVEVTKDWNPRTITHNNQPMPIGPLSAVTTLGAFRDVNQWRGNLGAMDLVQTVQKHFDNPATNHGFMINNASSTTYLRSFRSDNAPSRTEEDMDHAPRLLVVVHIPDVGGEPGFLDGTNVVLPPLADDTDLNEFLDGPDVLMVRLANGPDWPASWDVAMN